MSCKSGELLSLQQTQQPSFHIQATHQKVCVEKYVDKYENDSSVVKACSCSVKNTAQEAQHPTGAWGLTEQSLLKRDLTAICLSSQLRSFSQLRSGYFKTFTQELCMYYCNFLWSFLQHLDTAHQLGWLVGLMMIRASKEEHSSLIPSPVAIPHGSRMSHGCSVSYTACNCHGKGAGEVTDVGITWQQNILGKVVGELSLLPSVRLREQRQHQNQVLIAAYPK